jgi:hypothetical protein
MRTLFKINDDVYEDVIAHLLPPGNEQEQAAFLYVRPVRSPSQIVFEVIEAEKLGPGDYLVQEGDYLEMTDATRARVIKRAHDLDVSLAELHSHIGPWQARFSIVDQTGLKETVPHMWWRLRKRPYLAFVVAKSGFDALVWLDNPKVPRALDGMLAGNRLLRPTNLSLGGWQ